MNSREAKAKIAQQDALTELLRNTSGVRPIGVCEPELEPLARVDGVFVGDVQIVNNKPYRETARVAVTDKGARVMISGNLNSPIPARKAKEIFGRSDQWKLTRALHEDGANERRRLTNVK